MIFVVFEKYCDSREDATRLMSYLPLTKSTII